MAVLFLSIFSILLLIFSVVIYFESEVHRQKEYKTRLRQEALTAATIIFNKKEISPDLLKLLDKNNVTALNQEEIVIYDIDDKVIYESGSDSPNLKHALLDQIRNEVGVDQATQYNADASAALSGLLGNLQGAKQQLEAALGVITGQAPQVPGAEMGAAPDMGGEMPADLSTPGEEVADLDAAGADLDAAAQSAGLGRERR
jgi:hypothetical protein